MPLHAGPPRLKRTSRAHAIVRGVTGALRAETPLTCATTGGVPLLGEELLDQARAPRPSRVGGKKDMVCRVEHREASSGYAGREFLPLLERDAAIMARVNDERRDFDLSK